MESAGSVTQLIQQLPERDQDAVKKLWEAYFERLVNLARKKLGQTPTQAADAEDVALSAFASFCRCAEERRFPRLDDRDDLWQVLVMITHRKVCDQIKHEGRRRPRQGRLLQASALVADSGSEEALFADLIGREPDPAFAAQAAEEYRRLLAMLPNAEMRGVALWKLEGDTNEEIAGKMNDGAGCSVATVERKLKFIRRIWEKEIRA